MQLPSREQIAAIKDPEKRREAEELVVEISRVIEANPLAAFSPHSPAQRSFLDARTSVVAAFAGNQFGKSTSLVVRALRDCLPVGFVPECLLPGKRFGFDEPCHGWLLCPSNDKIYDSLFPALRKWAPREALHKGDIDSAYDKQHRVLRFARGDSIAFKTYEMEPDKLGGATLHWVGYDEPPPQLHRDEAMTRLLIHSGYEMFAMTPLKVNTGWIRREIYKQREDPDVTVVRGGMADNPLIDAKTRERILSRYKSDVWRQAREFGDFVDVGGLIYPDFERAVIDPPQAQLLASQDILVGIDPGIRNAGFSFVAVDDEGVMTVFDEGLLQDATVQDYAEFIHAKLDRWGIPSERAMFVIDPAARSRGQVSAETVSSALTREGIFCVHGQNDVEAGVQQIRTRLQHSRLRVSSECRITRDQADEYAAEDRDDGRFVVVKTNDHILDALRYVAMSRPWNPVMEAEAPEQQLGWRPGFAPKAAYLKPRPQSAPLGAMS